MFVCTLVFLKSNGFQKRNWETLFFFFLIKYQEISFPRVGQFSSALVLFGAQALASDSLAPHGQIGHRFPSLELNTTPLVHPPEVKMSDMGLAKERVSVLQQAGLE